jgi:peptide/nickel transport system substrate-binding protein
VADRERGRQRPFKIKRWQQGVLYEIEAVDSYWKGWPSKDHVGGVILKLVRESAAQRAALLRGEADIVEGLSATTTRWWARRRASSCRTSRA